MRIRTRLALLGTLLATSTVIVFAWMINGLAGRTSPQEQLDRLTTQAVATLNSFQPGSERPAVIRDPADLAPFILVFDDGGTLLYTDAEAEGTPIGVPTSLLSRATAEGVTERTGEFAWAAVRGDGVTAVAAQAIAAIERDLAGLKAVLVIASIVTAIAGALASWVVSGRALRPLVRLSRTAEEVALTGDLDARLPSRPARDEVGTLTLRFNTMMDVLSRSQRALEETLERQRRFAADASHELRSPLTTIRSNAGFLAAHPDAQPNDRRRAVDDIQAEADRMAALVDELLLLAGAEDGPEPAMSSIDLALVVRKVAETAGVGFAGTSAPLEANPDALTRVVWALVDNAVKHGAPPVEARVDADDGMVRLTVTDRGPGIAAADVDRVFERFHRGDPARTGPGTGLGLSIAQEIVHAHRGTIEVGNRPGGGAIATVTLPMV